VSSDDKAEPVNKAVSTVAAHKLCQVGAAAGLARLHAPAKLAWLKRTALAVTAIARGLRCIIFEQQAGQERPLASWLDIFGVRSHAYIDSSWTPCKVAFSCSATCVHSKFETPDGCYQARTCYSKAVTPVLQCICSLAPHHLCCRTYSSGKPARNFAFHKETVLIQCRPKILVSHTQDQQFAGTHNEEQQQLLKCFTKW